MRKRRSSILSITLLAVLLLTILSNAKTCKATTTILKIIPPPIEVIEGQEFTVSVNVYDVIDMQGFMFKISWDPEYVEYVSHTVCPPWPPPIIFPVPVVGENYVIIGAASGVASFTGSGVLATVTFHALKSGTTVITISEPVILPDPIVLITEDATITILPSSDTWISIAGIVTSYGSNTAEGLMNIFALTEENWAEGWCAFAVPPLGSIILIDPPPPFDFSLYLVRMVNASAVELNYDGYDCWVSGFWGVSNVTNPSTVRDIMNLMNSMYVVTGELGITGNWTYFTINIEGFEPIQGNITCHCIREISYNSERFPCYDVNRDYVVNMRDIGICCDNFGSILGFDGYEFNVDTNFDLQIDMRDIGNCCNSFGKEY